MFSKYPDEQVVTQSLPFRKASFAPEVVQAEQLVAVSWHALHFASHCTQTEEDVTLPY